MEVGSAGELGGDVFGVASLAMACCNRRVPGLRCGAVERQWVGLQMAAADPKRAPLRAARKRTDHHESNPLLGRRAIEWGQSGLSILLYLLVAEVRWRSMLI